MAFLAYENTRNGYEKIKVVFKIKADAPKENYKNWYNLHKRDHLYLILFLIPLP
jgi:hypothetical protein